MPNRLPLHALQLLALLLWSGVSLALSEAKELEIGREMHEKILAESPIHPDPELRAYIDRIGQKVAAYSDRNQLQYTFTVIDTPDLNAFAIPGGYIYIHRGLLTFLNSEAQLAAVLAHEVAHVDERHASQQDTLGKTSSVLSTIAAIVVGVKTGSGTIANTVGETGSLLGTAVVRGYGRDMELEADERGAEYLLKAGYDPQAMVEVIGLLKDHEQFSRLRAKETGKQVASYHGVFATHPRNDERLRQAVANAGTLHPDHATNGDQREFRTHIGGLAFDNHRQRSALRDNRYYHGPLNFTVAFPTGWQVVTRSSGLVAFNPQRSASLQLLIKQRDSSRNDVERLIDTFNLAGIANSEAINTPPIAGLTLQSTDTPPLRVALINLDNRSFLLRGESRNPQQQILHDILFRSTIASLRPLTELERRQTLALQVLFQRADEGVRYADLARTSPLPDYAEQQLRLLNGDYPVGEPSAGEWIKVVQ